MNVDKCGISAEILIEQTEMWMVICGKNRFMDFIRQLLLKSEIYTDIELL